jgi:hypothetical protein
MSSSCVAALEGQLRRILVGLSKNDTQCPCCPSKKRQKLSMGSCSRGTTASHFRLPLQKRHNTRAVPPPQKYFPTESTPPKEKSLFPFPRSTDPIPDASIDYTELWKAVSRANLPSAAAKSKEAGSNKGTAAYDDVLYRLGIDIEIITVVNDPEDITLDGLPPQPTVQYSHLSTDEQLSALAEQYKRYGEGLNEATLVARLMPNLFIFADVPTPMIRDAV